MVTTTKQWSNGDLVTLTYSGEGNGSVSVASTPNESIDRSMVINIATTKGTPEVTKSVIINQPGLREIFNASDGPFLLGDGTTFNVLKQ